jgi:hypothetical protein
MADQSQLGYSTLSDVINNYSSSDARAVFVQPAKILRRKTPLLEFLPMVASNNITLNVATRTDYIPVPTTRRLNEFASVTSSKNTAITDDIAMFVGWSVQDVETVKIQNNPTEYMADQLDNKVEGFGQKLSATMWYGSKAVDPGSFNGLATRFHNTTALPNGDPTWKPNVWDGGYEGGNSTSIWCFQFGKNKVQAIYPPNSPAGLEIRNLGEQTWTKNNNPSPPAGLLADSQAIQAYVTYLQWKIGLQVVDERCVQRIANVNPTALQSGDFDENILVQALGYLPDGGDAPGTVIIVNRGILNQMNIRAMSQKTNGYYTQNIETGDIWGARRITRFQGVQVVMDEMLQNNETTVTTTS